jgi:hypothetical protein
MQDIHETSSLIGANKVDGTKVFDVTGDELGKIHEIMIDKVSGKVAYAVMSFGGFMGLGENFHPLPWSALRYDTEADGYVIDMPKDRLQAAPAFKENERPMWTDRDYERRLHAYYNSPPYWQA